MNSEVLKPRDWLYVALALILLIVIEQPLLEGLQQLPTLPCQILTLALFAAAWGGFFALRNRHPLSADILSILGIWLFLKTPISFFSPQWILLRGICTILFFILPFIVRLRLVIPLTVGCVALLPNSALTLLRNFSLDAWAIDPALAPTLSILILFAWWLVGMRWRISGGSFRSYAWVGLVAYTAMIYLLKMHIDTLEGRHVPYYCSAIICAAPLLFILLRPRGGWGLLWPFYLATCAVLGACAFAALPAQALCELALAYGALLSYIAVRKKNDHALLYGAATIGMGICYASRYALENHMEMGGKTLELLAIGVGIAAALLLYYRVVRLLPKREEPPTANYPRTKLRRGLAIGIVCLQAGIIGALVLQFQYHMHTAPRIRMEADWVSDDSISAHWYDALLEVGAVHPLQDDPFFGKSLWWQQPGSARPVPADVTHPLEVTNLPTPVTAFLREGEKGLWSVSRVEATHSSEDVPQPGELRVRAELQIGAETTENAPRSVICTLPIHAEIMRVMQKAISPEHAAYPLSEADFTVELVIPSESTIIVSEVYMNGLPLREALKHPPHPAHGND